MKNFIKKTVSLASNCFFYHFVSKNKIENISNEMAENILQQYSSDPQTSALWTRSEIESDHDLTIIIPVYNVEKYLERCMESVLHQKTEYSYEVIVVNDCSPDNSIRIIDRYKDHPLVKFINHISNQGLSAARNTGLKEMRGRYVMFVDSDDYLPEHAVQALLETAYRLDADIVQGGYYKIDDVTDKILGICTYQYCESVPSNGVIAGMAWGKVYRSELFDQVCFPKGYWYEDTIITAIVSHLAKSIATIPDLVYYYRQNPKGIVRYGKGKPKSIDTFWVHRCVLKARKELGLETDIKFYEHLLRMVVLSYQRTVNVPVQIKKSLFALFGEMLRSERKDDFRVSKRYVNLEKAILNKEYGRYCFLCKFL